MVKYPFHHTLIIHFRLHKINRYLAPIVDELLEFWDGINPPATNKHPNGRKVRLAIICCFNDIPAVRKLCERIWLS